MKCYRTLPAWAACTLVAVVIFLQAGDLWASKHRPRIQDPKGQHDKPKHDKPKAEHEKPERENRRDPQDRKYSLDHALRNRPSLKERLDSRGRSETISTPTPVGTGLIPEVPRKGGFTPTGNQTSPHAAARQRARSQTRNLEQKKAQQQQPANRTVLAGHGGWAPGDGWTVVPRGTTITFVGVWGAELTHDAGRAIEEKPIAELDFVAQHPDRSVYPNKSLAEPLTYRAGERIPNYMLFPIDMRDLSTEPEGKRITVKKDRKLSDLLHPDMGDVEWAACRTFYANRREKYQHGVSKGRKYYRQITIDIPSPGNAPTNSVVSLLKRWWHQVE